MSLRLRDWSLTAQQKKQQNEQIRQKLAMGLSPEARQYFYQSMLATLASETAERGTEIRGQSLLMKRWHGAAASSESAEDLFAEPLSSP
jgi:hypothetical protein